VGPAKCLNGFAHGNYPAVPYGAVNANQSMDALVEEGFKQIRGSITEGRYVTIESDGLGLAITKKGKVIGLQSTKAHEDIRQRWILHTADGNRFGNRFYIQSASNKSYVSTHGDLTADVTTAKVFVLEYRAKGSTYTLRADGAASDKYISFSKLPKSSAKCPNTGKVNWEGEVAPFKIYGVNYHA
jgi:phospholipase C